MSKVPSMKRIVCMLSGLSLLLFGALGTFVGIVAIVDPIGTKLADDGDPFGVPPTTTESAFMLLMYLALMSLGVWLSWRGGHTPASGRKIRDARAV